MDDGTLRALAARMMPARGRGVESAVIGAALNAMAGRSLEAAIPVL